MKETARKFLEELFACWCDAIEEGNEGLIKVFYNQLMGACDMYEKVFNETVYFRARARKIRYEENEAD